MTSNPNSTDFIQLVRVARGLEAGGFYNASKYLWAIVFSQVVREGGGAALVEEKHDWAAEMESVIASMEQGWAAPDMIAALRAGQQGARENRTIPLADTPPVYVCRTCGEIMLGDLPEQCPSCSAHALTIRHINPIYFAEYLSPRRVVEALRRTPADLSALIADLSDEQLNRAPAPGAWSIRETLWHILVADGMLVERVERILTEDHPALSAVPVWTAESKESLSARAILEHFRLSRVNAVSRLQYLSADAWARTAVHEEWGEVTLLDQATYFARHERSHWAQIVRAKQAVS